MKNLSVVIPVFNDTLSLNKLITDLQHVSAQHHYLLNIILVDDGSSPETWQQLKNLKACYTELITLARLKSNQGQQRATLCGLLLAQGDITITMDADGQHPPSEIPKLVNALVEDNHDLVYGAASLGHPWHLQLASRLFKLLLHRPGSIIDRKATAFRCFNNKLKHKIINNLPSQAVNIDALLLRSTKNPTAVNTLHRKRLAGTSTYTFGARVKLVLTILLNNQSFKKTAATSVFLLFATSFLLFVFNKNNSITVISLSASSLSLALLIYTTRQSKKRYPPLQDCIAEIDK